MNTERAEQFDFYVFVIILVVVGVTALFFLIDMIFDHQKITRDMHEKTVQTCVQEEGTWVPWGAEGGMCLIKVEVKK